jgi:hypothetical protein
VVGWVWFGLGRGRQITGGKGREREEIELTEDKTIICTKRQASDQTEIHSIAMGPTTHVLWREDAQTNILRIIRYRTRKDRSRWTGQKGLDSTSYLCPLS